METLYKNKVLSPVFQVVWSLMHYNKDILKHYTKNTHKDTLSASKWLFFIYIHIYTRHIFHQEDGKVLVSDMQEGEYFRYYVYVYEILLEDFFKKGIQKSSQESVEI